MTDPGEADLRRQLAACYRLIARAGMDDLTGNHCTLRLPGDAPRMLINPYGMLFSEITASSLIVVDFEGNKLTESDWPVNKAGIVIHGAIHAARPDLHCVIHTHTNAGMALSVLAGGLLPITQSALRFHDAIGYHDYEGSVRAFDEQARLVRNLGPHKAMILRNHGLLTAGRSVAEAFYLMHNLEKACVSQLAAMATGDRILIPDAETCAHAARQQQAGTLGMDRMMYPGEREFPALMRLLDREAPDYRD